MKSGGKVVKARGVAFDGGKKYSDQIANGDLEDDRQLEDEKDNNDSIVDVNGYVIRGSQKSTM